jgi:hypothetical protein
MIAATLLGHQTGFFSRFDSGTLASLARFPIDLFRSSAILADDLFHGLGFVHRLVPDMKNSRSHSRASPYYFEAFDPALLGGRSFLGRNVVVEVCHELPGVRIRASETLRWVAASGHRTNFVD